MHVFCLVLICCVLLLFSPVLFFFWGGGGVYSQGDCRVIALSETTRDQVVQSINLFLSSMVYRVLIVSYEVGVSGSLNTPWPMQYDTSKYDMK